MLLLKQGYEVWAVDRREVAMEGVTCFRESAILEGIDLVVLSSGIPKSHPQAQGRKVVGEAELALRFLPNRMVAITGTNGKSTLTLLVTHILNEAGIPARAVGNIGNSLGEYASAPDACQLLVVELSSYQLEHLSGRPFEGGLITNITPDHLDRYPSFKAYQEVKRSLRLRIKEGGWFIGEDSYLQLKGKEGYSLPEMAQLMCQRLGVESAAIERACASFQRPPHRMEEVKSHLGLYWINDSKATNPAATLYALSQLTERPLLIAGGASKGGSFEVWKRPFARKVKEVYLIGESALAIESALKGALPTFQCGSLHKAVRAACQRAERGETILLSPGCSSLDQFKNYEERGEMFKEEIGALEKER